MDLITESDWVAPALADLQPVTLTGRRVTVDPLTLADAADMYEFGRDQRMWNFMPRAAFASTEDARGFIAEALVEQERGYGVPFAVRDKREGTMVGHLRLLDPQPMHGSVEVGWVMIKPDMWSARLALEAGYLLFAHAFETLGVSRLWMKTDADNMAARRTMEVGGMSYEGTLRKHGLVRPGYLRDSAIYSATAEDWVEKHEACAELLASLPDEPAA